METMIAMHATPLADACMSAGMPTAANWTDVTCAKSTLCGIVVHMLCTEGVERVYNIANELKDRMSKWKAWLKQVASTSDGICSTPQSSTIQ